MKMKSNGHQDNDWSEPDRMLRTRTYLVEDAAIAHWLCKKNCHLTEVTASNRGPAFSIRTAAGIYWCMTPEGGVK